MSYFKIYCPSYRRYKTACTHNIFNIDDFYYVVNDSEYTLYKETTNSNIVVIPDGVTKNIVETRNWILNNSDVKYIVQVDDDLTAINFIHTEQNKRICESIDKDQIHDVIDRGFSALDDLNLKLFGMNNQNDPTFYHQNKPISFSSVVNATFCGIIKTDMRYDENITLKEDYDFFIRNVKQYGGVIRYNYFHYDCDHYKLAGGCQAYRNHDLETQNLNYLKKKHGDIVGDPMHSGYNPVIRF